MNAYQKFAGMTKDEYTQAVTQFARKHGYYVRTVRVMTVLRLAAVKEWKERHGTT